LFDSSLELPEQLSNNIRTINKNFFIFINYQKKYEL